MPLGRGETDEFKAQILLPLELRRFSQRNRETRTWRINESPPGDGSLPSPCLDPHALTPGAGRTNQSGRTNSWAGAGGYSTNVVQHRGGRRDRRRDANHARDQRMERRHHAASGAGQFRRHDCAGQKRSSLQSPNLTRLLRDELRPRAGQPAAPDDSVFQLSRTNRTWMAELFRTASTRFPRTCRWKAGPRRPGI